ncbi:MAG TPA: Holliday junction branch migration protein RuvA [Spirochaetota bacterium]|nr:Holliday junction branch migration protein RuvA [Spirochaetota bacterium]HPF06768.1 Holliday junction branch migration protein RuvA [Spirochaetota bacterium]HPJ41712.1 Holliday junction branch migration protein RuvA [Spirochaetota bacterium]HPR36622.1 Holliday junction branch migration protein RuvA [Spirochaetota bacterium]HRX48617.1 Holliday junction branch migration protein RuvA [Spirochaetota bacterium]
MIGKLKGAVEDLKPTEVIIDVNGVGFELTIPFSTYEKIQGEKHATLLVFTMHKEDQFRLFGFHSRIEKDIFKSLLAVSGIGPSMAISLLSGMTPENLIESVKNGNISALTKIPGIGKSKAEKLIFDLKRKLPQLERISGPVSAASSDRHDAVEALAALGFDENKASACVNEILKSSKDATLEDIIKQALKLLA